jgi:hypothetical protein
LVRTTVDKQEEGWISNAEERERAKRLEEKSREGELTQREKGQLGAYRSRKATEDEPDREHTTRSWMAGEDTRAPELSESTKKEVERIREKQERGETLTRHEAGVLGGAARAEKE